jgi:hypothetical protein
MTADAKFILAAAGSIDQTIGPATLTAAFRGSTQPLLFLEAGELRTWNT